MAAAASSTAPRSWSVLVVILCFSLLLDVLLCSTEWGVAALSMPRGGMPPLVNKHATAEFSCSECTGPFYSQGLETYRVPMAMFELNRARVVRALADRGYRDGVVLLQGGNQQTRYDTDNEPVFRQESYFHWAFGVAEPGVYGAVSLPRGNATLFVPRYGRDYEVFCGRAPSPEQVRETYGVENVLPLDDLPAFLAHELAPQSDFQYLPTLHLLSGLNTDSGNMAVPAHYDGIHQHATQISTDVLFDCMQHCRVFKTNAEVDVLRYTHWVSSMAHVEVMRSVQPGMMEYQLESLFQHHTYTHGGCRHMSYTCICACGPNPAVLHYGHAGAPNNRLLRDGDLALLDMGAEYHCYASDITCSYPVNGVFSQDQQVVYEAVLDAQVSVIGTMKPGVKWPEMHRAAERSILKGLVKAGLLTGDVDDMIAADLGAVFMPHGLGHLIGVDTHDVGGYGTGSPPRSNRPGLKNLRTARVLQRGMVLTVEPGCYFIDLLLDAALADPQQRTFLNADRLSDFRGFGGFRLEDGILVTEDGCENLTMCPRSISEVTGVMSGRLAWPPTEDVMPELRRNWVKRTKEGKMELLQL